MKYERIKSDFKEDFILTKKYDKLLVCLIILAQVSEAEENDTDEFRSCEYNQKRDSSAIVDVTRSKRI